MEQNTDHIIPPSRLERLSRVAEYLAFGTSGIWLAMFPPETIRQTAWGWIIYFLSASLLAGFPAAISAAKGRFRGEYGSLAFIATPVLVTAISLWIFAIAQSKPTTVFFALIVSALWLKLLARFWALGHLVKAQLQEDRD